MDGYAITIGNLHTQYMKIRIYRFGGSLLKILPHQHQYLLGHAQRFGGQMRCALGVDIERLQHRPASISSSLGLMPQ
jgi:hypothetical protein